MVWFGKVQNGKIILEPGARLTEGEIVRVEPVSAAQPAANGDPDPADRIGDEAVETGIPDLASQHDHYIYGTPKRKE